MLRYIDKDGHECAFYDTALLFPLNALQLDGDSLGVAVLDMSDPANPVQTDHAHRAADALAARVAEPQRQARAARRGARQPGDLPGPGLRSTTSARTAAIPVLQSTTLIARFGHESGFSPDGKTFYAAGTALRVRSPRST